MRASIILVSLLILTTACVSSMEKGDQSYARGDWDAAVEYYERALASAKEPAEIEHIQSRLETSRVKAGEQHRKSAIQHRSAGRVGDAYEEATAAMKYQPTEANRRLVDELRLKYAEKLRNTGRAALAANRWDEAVETLSRAEELQSTPEAARLLVQARSGAEEYHRQAFERAVADARAAMQARDWENAWQLFREARNHGEGTVTDREAEFCLEMRDAEATTNPMTAERHYQRALAYDIDVEYVRSRMFERVPQSYTVTIRGATVLPFKPGTGQPWDGAAKAVDISAFQARLAEIAGSGAPDPLRLSGLVAQFGARFDPPDCYLEVFLGADRHGGPELVRKDSYEPVWNISIPVRATTTSPDEFRVRIVDQDRTPPHDLVGEYATTLGEIVREPGERELVLFDERGQLHAGGILVLRIGIGLVEN